MSKHKTDKTGSLKGFHHYVGRCKKTRALANRRERAAARRANRKDKP